MSELLDEFSELDLKITFDKILSTLSNNEEKVIRNIFMSNKRPVEVAREMKMTRQHVNYLYNRAMYKLRQGCRAKYLKPYLHN